MEQIEFYSSVSQSFFIAWQTWRNRLFERGETEEQFFVKHVFQFCWHTCIVTNCSIYLTELFHSLRSELDEHNDWLLWWEEHLQQCEGSSPAELWRRRQLQIRFVQSGWLLVSVCVGIESCVHKERKVISLYYLWMSLKNGVRHFCRSFQIVTKSFYIGRKVVTRFLQNRSRRYR